MAYSGTKAISGRGTLFQIGGVHGAVGTETWTTVGELMSAPVDSGKWNTVDCTNFQSGLDDEFITTTRTPPDITLKGNRISTDAGQALVVAAQQSGQLYDFKEVLPLQQGQTTTGDTIAYAALVVNYKFDPDVKSQLQWEVTLKVSGPQTTTEGS